MIKLLSISNDAQIFIKCWQTEKLFTCLDCSLPTHRIKISHCFVLSEYFKRWLLFSIFKLNVLCFGSMGVIQRCIKREGRHNLLSCGKTLKEEQLVKIASKKQKHFSSNVLV